MNTINVLMLVPNLRVSNGVASYAMNYFRSIDHTKVKIDFALFNDIPSPYYEEIAAAGSRYYVLPKLKNFSEHLKCCKRILENGNYNIIHDNTLLVSLPIMHFARGRVSVRILHSHNSKLGETKLHEVRNRLFLPFLRACSTTNAACSNLAARAMFGKETFKFIPNVVNTRKFKFDEDIRKNVREQMLIKQKKVVLTVGRTAEQKNPFFAIDVIKAIHEKYPNIEYWWVGSGPLDEKMKNYVNDIDAAGYIKLLGSREDVVDLYQAADVFFLPSLFEGLPVTCIEAQAVGLPIVLSDSITKELVYTDLVQYVNLKQERKQWAEAIIRAIDRDNNRSQYNYELQNSHFSDECCGELLYRWYKSLL